MLHAESARETGPLTPEDHRSIGVGLLSIFEGILAGEYLRNLVSFYAEHQGQPPSLDEH
jgi:hypothetical protein